MEIEYTIKNIQKKIDLWRKSGLSIGFVPTMGYLHAGHISLIKKAKQQNHKVIVSIFVNPAQFGKGEDLDTYPRDIEKDRQLISDVGADVIFNPDIKELYPDYPDMGAIKINISHVSDYLCGAKRPGHFDGVCLVLAKLFNIVQADRAYFGEKDYQQLIVVKKLVQDLNIPIEIIGCPIVRDETGLALSSRNSYLTSEEKIIATVLNKSLLFAKNMVDQGTTDSNQIIKNITDKINSEPNTKIDYVQIVCPDKLIPLGTIVDKGVIALAVFVGKTRLIDNIFVQKGD